MTAKSTQPNPKHVDRFANSRFAGGLGAVSQLKRPRLKKHTRERIREEVPRLPGVYGLFNAAGHLIYVGMSKNLRQRLQIYFGAKRGGKKEIRIGSKVCWILFQPVAHELIARLRERELIREFKPVYNQQGHPTRMPVGYLYLLNYEASSFKVQKHFPKKHAGVWGPLPLTKNTRAAVEGLNLHFQLRDCPKETPMHYSCWGEVPAEATACIRLDLGTCLAPCVGKCSKKKYEGMVTQAKTFLAGRSRKVLDDIELQMQRAGQQQRYEQAARLRDRFSALSRMERYLRRFHDWMDRATFVYSMHSASGKQTLWMIIVRGTIQTIVPKPKTATEKRGVHKLLLKYQQQLTGETAESLKAQPNDFEAGRLLYKWFHTHPDQKKKRRKLKAIIRGMRN